MNDDDRITALEAVLAQFLRPIKNVPFDLVIKAIANSQVIPMDPDAPSDKALVADLVLAAARVGALVRDAPIRRNRPNEVGNDIEPFVMSAIQHIGLQVERPRSTAGRGQQAGYPDILLFDRDDRPSYLECKIFGEGSAFTTMRSFYLSPSQNSKVSCDARHLLMAFAVSRDPIAGSRDSFYRPTGFKLLDLFALKCDVKYEFNSDNRRLYEPALLLAEGSV